MVCQILYQLPVFTKILHDITNNIIHLEIIIAKFDLYISNTKISKKVIVLHKIHILLPTYRNITITTF